MSGLLTGVDLVYGGLMGGIFNNVKYQETYATYMELYCLEVVWALLILHSLPLTWLLAKGRKAKLKLTGFYLYLLLLYFSLVGLGALIPGFDMFFKGVCMPFLLPAPPGL